VSSTRPDGPDLLSRSITWLGRAIPNLGIVLGALVIVVFALLMLGYNRRLRGQMTRMWLLGRILRPRLTIEKLDDGALADGSKVGTPVAARIKERLAAYNEEAQGAGGDGSKGFDAEHEIDFGTGVEELADLVSGDSALRAAFDKASGLSDQTKAVMALADLMYAALPIPKLKVSGVLSPPFEQAVSATLNLEMDASQRAAVTLTRPTGETATSADFLGLADPGAVWVQYEVARAVARAPVKSEEAESYALVREGLDRYFAGDPVGALAAYKKAIGVDPKNWAAYVNRAVLIARVDRDYQQAIGLCQDALDQLTEAEQGNA
jgi:tetratricopeptide (TPR) repeat protein